MSEWDAHRLAAIGVVAQVCAAGAVLFTMAVVWEFSGWSQWNDSTYDLWFWRCVTLVSAAAALVAVGLPWLTVRRASGWSVLARRVVPAVGLASLVGSLVGFISIGRTIAAVIEALIGPIEHTSFWALLIAAASLAGFVGGAFAAPLVLIRAVRTRDARRLTNI